jgi:hypothetical protein
MRCIEVIRAGDQSIAVQLTEIRQQLDRERIWATDLRAVRAVGGWVSFGATFEHPHDANHCLRTFAGRG